ncbi:MAG: type II secretion system protein GspI [Gemmataceae bacterium]|nr:type II secretion system protein GspI [Gemmataceae bacterium]
MVAIGRLVDIGSDHAAAARLHSRGTRLAQAKLAEVEAGVVGMDGGSGSFDTEAGWSWTVEAQPQGPPNLYAVTVKVSFDDRGRPFEVTLSQLVLDPAKMGSAAQAEKPTEADVQAAETNAEGM